MTRIAFPYGKQKLNYVFNDAELLGTLEPSINHYTPLTVPTC